MTYSYTTLDAGTDLRAHGIPIVVPANTTGARYQTRAGTVREVEGTREAVIAALRAAGYRIAADPVPTPPPKTGPWTGKPLRRARLAAGLSPEGLAELLRAEPGCGKVSPQTVRANEPGPRGGKAPNATLFGAYARVLGVSMESLLAVEE